MAPEVIAEKPYGVKADVFSFGIVVLEMLTLEYPYDSLTIAQGSWDTFDNAIVNGLRPPIPEDVPLSIARLVRRCWATNSLKRPSMDEVIEQLKLIEMRYVADRSEIIESLTSEGSELVHEEKNKNRELQRQLKLAQKQIEHLSLQLNQPQMNTKEELNTINCLIAKKKRLKRELKQHIKQMNI
eukprot:TRINITY_DN5465_c0_g1_i1.p1 TRINITY_DN5465_c0_g1~~TRINITY_DN5465_c0_g1_i1.p1  ORF type:complete len:184 (+),score=19.45 TRINITY_DN5465_c0_g1_i1:300-851(+)